MDWTNPFKKKKDTYEPDVGGGTIKLNPSQHDIADGTKLSDTPKFTLQRAYENIEIVTRGVNMVVNDVTSIPLEVTGDYNDTERIAVGARLKSVQKLLAHKPNEFQDISWFLRDCVTDYLLDGNIFIYFDGTYLYHLPATKVSVEPSKTNFIMHYQFDGGRKYKPDEIIHIKDNSFTTIFRGMSRLKSAKNSIELIHNMRNFQSNFFKNGAVPGLVIKSPNTLSQKIKTRLINSWSERYSPNSGGRRPLILDGGLEIDSLSGVDFKELDFNESLGVHERMILKALGIPPILIETGNNANVRPNLRLYYLETIMPIVNQICKALERYFGYTVRPDLTTVMAVQPELKDIATYHSTLVNTGILTPNEARDALGKEEIEGGDELRIPANIAGSAANPAEGGRPEEDNENT